MMSTTSACTYHAAQLQFPFAMGQRLSDGCAIQLAAAKRDPCHHDQCSLAALLHYHHSVTDELTPPGAGAKPFTAGRVAAPSKVQRVVVCDAARMQFIKGVDEPCVPEVKLTRSRTGGAGTAIFSFDNPSIFQASGGLPRSFANGH